MIHQVSLIAMAVLSAAIGPMIIDAALAQSGPAPSHRFPVNWHTVANGDTSQVALPMDEEGQCMGSVSTKIELEPSFVGRRSIEMWTTPDQSCSFSLAAYETQEVPQTQNRGRGGQEFGHLHEQRAAATPTSDGWDV